MSEIAMLEIAILGLKEQLDRIERKLNAVAENTVPCEQKQQANQANMEAVKQLLEKSPLAQNPMIKEMMGPLMQIFENQKGGRA